MKQPTAEAITHLRNRIHIIIEGTDTRLGKLFDIVLLIAILTSVGCGHARQCAIHTPAIWHYIFLC